MLTGSRIALGLAVGLIAAVVVTAALVVATMGASGAQEPTDLSVRPLQLAWVEPDEVRVPPIAGGLEPTTVLEVRATGYTADTTGTVRQCATGTLRRCRNQLTVRTDNRGVAVFQYLVTDAVDLDGACRLASQQRCTLELSIGERRTEIDTVFVDDAPTPGRITLDPDADLTIGDTVTVNATGFPPRTELTLQVCAASATRGDRCGPPGPVAIVVTDAAGSGRTTLALDIEQVGEAGIACGRRTPCQVVASSSTVGARAAPARLELTTTPSAGYDRSRLAAGLLLAALLAAAAARLVRATDWRPPAEADASAIDNAVWADLDAEAEAFEEAASRP